MRYIDAGYIIGLSVLFVYSASLLLRRRRLQRAVAARGGQGDPSTDTGRTSAGDHLPR